MYGISIVITVYNEEKNIRDLLHSLILQEQPIEIIIVDSMSSDKTVEIIKHYTEKYNFIRYYRKKSTRGEGRNYGVSLCKYDYIAFTDGDAVAHEYWIKNLRKLINEYDLIAGETLSAGNKKYSMERLKLFYKGFEITRPSANLCYSKELFNKIGGFDEKFVTGEDIDLNIRAINANARYICCNDCIIYNKTRENLHEFLAQAYWNGYGRAQLKAKYKDIKFDHSNELKRMFIPKYIIRNGFGLLGYLKYKREKIN